MAAYGQRFSRDLVSHTRKVQNLFKRICRNEESFHRDYTDIHFTWATVRAEFEKHRNVRDLRTAKMLMEEGEHKLFMHIHHKPKKFLWSPGGLMYERDHIVPDHLLDMWHPIEKAAYPEFFAAREERKKDLQQLYEKTYGKPEGDHHH